MTQPTTPLTDEQLDHLPVFPLPNVVFFPGAILPLHVFEPRYRNLVRYCLSHGEVMGIPLLKPGYTAEEYENNPPLHPVLGAGRLIGHQALPDGRSNILVQGIERLEYLSEVSTDFDFRILRTRRLDCAGEVSATQHETLRGLALQLAQHLPQAQDALSRLLSEAGSPALLADQLSAYLIGDLEERQRLLEMLDVPARVDHLVTLLGALYLQLADPSGGGPAN